MIMNYDIKCFITELFEIEFVYDFDTNKRNLNLYEPKISDGFFIKSLAFFNYTQYSHTPNQILLAP